MTSRRGWAVLVVGAAILTLTSGASLKACETPQPAPGGKTLAVLVTGLWEASGTRRVLDVAHTARGKTETLPRKVGAAATKGGSYQFKVVISPGESVSITVDQQGGGFIQCKIETETVPVRTLDYEHRNDEGTASCHYTYAIQPA